MLVLGYLGLISVLGDEGFGGFMDLVLVLVMMAVWVLV